MGLLFRELEPMRGIVAHADEIAEIVNAIIGKGLYAVLADAVDPDAAVFDVHFAGDVRQSVFIDGEVLGHARNGRDVMDFVDVHRHAARWESAGTGGDQFLGKNSSIR